MKQKRGLAKQDYIGTVVATSVVVMSLCFCCLIELDTKETNFSFTK